MQLNAFTAVVFLDVRKDECKTPLLAVLVAELFGDVLGRFKIIRLVEFQRLFHFFEILQFALGERFAEFLRDQAMQLAELFHFLLLQVGGELRECKQ